MTTKKHEEPVLFETGATTACKRCELRCQINPVPGSKATMLKRSKTTGLCINGAVHDHLRHIYPANLLLARSGPKSLVLPHVQKQFFGLCRLAGTDARFEEIDWQRIIDNWELPFSTKLQSTAANPVTQEELDREREQGRAAMRDGWKPPLSEQEQRAKERAELDHAMLNVRNLLNPEGPPVKNVTTRDDGYGTITAFIEREHNEYP